MERHIIFHSCNKICLIKGWFLLYVLQIGIVLPTFEPNILYVIYTCISLSVCMQWAAGQSRSMLILQCSCWLRRLYLWTSWTLLWVLNLPHCSRMQNGVAAALGFHLPVVMHIFDLRLTWMETKKTWKWILECHVKVFTLYVHVKVGNLIKGNCM